MAISARNNSIANLISRCWSILANFIFVPVYISLLGAEAYGLTTFFATLQVVLNLLGLGLSQTLRREFAASDVSGKTLTYKYKLLRSVELVYFGIGLLIVVFCIVSSDYISSSWLHVGDIDTYIAKNCIIMMGISISSQLLANLYFGGMMGLSKQITANTLQISWSVIKNCGVIIVLYFIQRNVLLYFCWFALCDILYFVVNRILLFRSVNAKEHKWQLKDFALVKGVYKYAVGIMAISVGYVINTQVDKLIISHNFDLLHVGAYNTTFSMSYLTSIVASSVAIAMFPIFTNLFTSNKENELHERFLEVNKLVNIGTATIGMFLAVYSYEILLVWTRNEAIADVMRLSAIFVVLGTTITTLQDLPYNFLLAHGKTLPNNIQTFACLLYVLIFTPLMIHRWGLFGAGLAWLIEMGLSTSLYLAYFYHRFFPCEGTHHVIIYTVGPLLISALLSIGTYNLLHLYVHSPLLIVLGGMACGLASLLIEAYIFTPNIIRNIKP